MELILATDLTALTPIRFNFEELKGGLYAQLEKYRNLVIGDEDIPEAKKDRAELNKLINSIEAERKKIKKQYLEPYDRFEAQLKELLAMIELPCGEIDSKVKDFESRQKKTKRDAIERFYTDNVKGLAGKITLDKIYNPKWDTQAEKLIAITQEIMDIFDRINSDVATIKSMNLKFEPTVLERFFDNLNLGDALKENVRLIAIDTAAAEREAAKQAAIEAEKQEAFRQASTAAAEAKPAAQVTAPPTEEKRATEASKPLRAEKLHTVDIRIQGTQAQLENLLDYLSENKIIYGEVPKSEVA